MIASGAGAPLELWGGVECTVVQIGDQFRNQLVDTGHASRMSDIEAMASEAQAAHRGNAGDD